MGPPVRRGWGPLVFGLAALAACWNPASAPFALATGLAALVLSALALRRGARAPAALGLAVSLAALVGAAVVLGRAAGVGRDAPGAALVGQPTRDEAARRLDEAAAATRQARERAGRELDRLEKTPPSN